MYLSDLLNALDKKEPIKLSRLKILQIFRRDKPLNDTQRIHLFHRLDLRYRDGERLTQEEVARIVGVSRELVAQYDAGNLPLSP